MRRSANHEEVMQIAPFLARSGDCAVWCLATFLSKPYEEVVAAAAQLDPQGGLNGLYLTQMIAIAAGFGVTLKRRETINLDPDTGILGIQFPRYKHGHVVVLKRGQILDMRGRGISVWDADVWVATKRAKVDGLLVIAERVV